MAEEKATLIVGGKKFEDWESVWCQHTWGDPFQHFRFTAAEREPTAKTYQLLQIKPEDECIIELDGELAINGMVVTRQAAFDEGNHGVLLQGVGMTWTAARASIIHETNSFDGKSFMQIAEEILKPTGIKGTKIGTISDKPFKRAHTPPGANIFDFLKELASERSVLVTCTKDGDFLFVGEGGDNGRVGALVEGVNIRKCQAVISISTQRSDFIINGQSAADDKDKMRKQAEQTAKEKGTMKKYSPILVPNEYPVWTQEELQERAKNEAMWTEAQQIQATIVVQGWKAGTGKLWEAGKGVSVQSQMAMINQELRIQSVTYTQDNNSGTLTTLLCVPPWGINAPSDYKIGSGGDKAFGIGHN
jgi:prophage tail gpP-like protein